LGSPNGLWVIGVYKLGKAVVLFVVGLLILRTTPNDMAADLSRFASSLGIDPESPLVRRAVSRLSGLGFGQLSAVGLAFVVYGWLDVAQGVGLLLQRRWGEYLVVVNAGILIPFEAFEMFQTRHFLPALALSINVVILAYVANRLHHERGARSARTESAWRFPSPRRRRG